MLIGNLAKFRKGEIDPGMTAEVPSLTERMVGQDRALRAVSFGVAMPNKGYNIYAMGPPGAGKMSSTTAFLSGRAREMPRPDDWCYVMILPTWTDRIISIYRRGKGR